MNSTCGILIADDHPIFRAGLRQVIERQKEFRVLAEAEDGRTALRLVQEHKPKIAVLDVVMPDLDGLGVLREIQRLRLPTAVIFLTMFKEEDLFHEAMDFGLRGYVLKENAVSDIVNCLRSVAAGDYFISPAISNLMVKRSQRVIGLARQKPELESLTPAERRVLHFIAAGKTSREIAAELFISVKTVENHRLNIATKLDIHGSNALLKFALENKSRL